MENMSCRGSSMFLIIIRPSCASSITSICIARTASDANFYTLNKKVIAQKARVKRLSTPRDSFKMQSYLKEKYFNQNQKRAATWALQTNNLISMKVNQSK